MEDSSTFMEDVDLYGELTESVVAKGITEEKLLSVARYKEGKSLQDFKDAVYNKRNEGGSWGYEQAIARMAQRIKEVIEFLDPNQTGYELRSQLKS